MRGRMQFSKDEKSVGISCSCCASKSFTLCLSLGSENHAGQFSVMTGKLQLSENDLNNFSLQYTSGLITLKSLASIVY